MATLIIKRSSEWSSRIRDYHIYVDGKKIGEIANGETKKFTVPAGLHTVKAKIDWCGSQEFKIELTEEEVQEVEVSGFAFGKWMMPLHLCILALYVTLRFFAGEELASILLILVLPMLLYLLYLLTFGRQKFLRLKVA
ncbi:DUF2846 domain-containing protein [Pontibacter harenae]|uniref:DUF2846 domain-containing protein n=1 Tax=Pontibacter harenae TaxID=2894083 RepID=UPI001E3B7F68|nr:DUF2846 domain-containing protein [Pontibacter harenae]MCC9165364.1 DUF2846 domain-containing protein [Pontibacter harenae]